MNNLKKILEQQERTANWLSKKIGVSSSTVYNWCENRQQPDVTQLTKIKDVLNVTFKELING